jgi:hypothetical protein
MKRLYPLYSTVISNSEWEVGGSPKLSYRKSRVYLGEEFAVDLLDVKSKW